MIFERDVTPDVEIKELIDSIVEEAETLWKSLRYDGWYPQKGFGIVDLAPYHVAGYGSAGWGSSEYWAASIAASNTWQDWINGAQTSMSYLINTGIFNLEPMPRITHIHPNIGGMDLSTQNIEEMQAFSAAVSWYEKPLSVAPEENFILRIKATNSGVERIGLMGYAIIRAAYSIHEK